MTSILPVSVSLSIPHLDNGPARNTEFRRTRDFETRQPSVSERDDADVRHHADERSAERRRKARAADDENQRSQSEAKSKTEQFGQVLVNQLAETGTTAPTEEQLSKIQKPLNTSSQTQSQTAEQQPLSASKAAPQSIAQTGVADQSSDKPAVKQAKPLTGSLSSANESQPQNTDDGSPNNAALDRVLFLQQQSAGSAQRTDGANQRNTVATNDRSSLNGASRFVSTPGKSGIEAGATEKLAGPENSDVQQILSDLDNGKLPFTIEDFQLNPADEALIQSRDLHGKEVREKGAQLDPFNAKGLAAASDQTASSALDNRQVPREVSYADLFRGEQAGVTVEHAGTAASAPDDAGVWSSGTEPVSEAPGGTDLQAAVAAIRTMEPRSDDSGYPSDSGQKFAGAESLKGNSASISTGSAAAVTSFAELVSSEIRQPLSSQVSQAVYEHLQRQSGADKPTLTMRLDPPELGELVISMKQTKEGMSIRVTAREPVTMDMLLARGEEIQQQLKETNVDLSELEFTRSDNNGNSERDSSHPRGHEGEVAGRFSAFGRRAVAVAQQADVAESVARSVQPSGTLSFRA